MENELRAMHTMTVREFVDWTKGALGSPFEKDVVAERHIQELMENTFTNLSKFYSFLSCYGNFDSITWLIENGFDVSFTHARQNGRNRL